MISPDLDRTRTMIINANRAALLRCHDAASLRRMWAALSEQERSDLRTSKILAAHARDLIRKSRR